MCIGVPNLGTFPEISTCSQKNSHVPKKCRSQKIQMFPSFLERSRLFPNLFACSQLFQAFPKIKNQKITLFSHTWFHKKNPFDSNILQREFRQPCESAWRFDVIYQQIIFWSALSRENYLIGSYHSSHEIALIKNYFC
jgi:hypothetical protein